MKSKQHGRESKTRILKGIFTIATSYDEEKNELIVVNVYKKRTARGQKTLVASFDPKTRKWTYYNDKTGGVLPVETQRSVEKLTRTA